MTTFEDLRQHEISRSASRAERPANVPASSGLNLLSSAAAPTGSLFGVTNSRSAKVLREIAHRIRLLQSQFLEETGQLPSQESLITLRRFLEVHQETSRPSISVDVDGHFSLSWRKVDGSLALRLLSPAEIHYSMIRSDQPQSWGTAPLDTLFELLPEALPIVD